MQQTDLVAPYYAVIFSNQRNHQDPAGYQQMAEAMETLARQQVGFLGIDSSRNAEGFGITVSYWDSEAAILSWRKQLDHRHARQQGRELWYEHYTLHVAKVERSYGWQATP